MASSPLANPSRRALSARRPHASIDLSRPHPLHPTALFSLLATALAAALLLSLSGCDGSPTEPGSEISFQTVAKSTVPNRSGPTVREVVRDEAQWRAAWSSLWGAGAPPLPAIDFGREMVAVATAGITCTGDVEIEQIERQGARLVVHIADAGPNPCALCFAAETVFHAVRLERIDLPERFEVRIVPPRCAGA